MASNKVVLPVKIRVLSESAKRDMARVDNAFESVLANPIALLVLGGRRFKDFKRHKTQSELEREIFKGLWKTGEEGTRIFDLFGVPYFYNSYDSYLQSLKRRGYREATFYQALVFTERFPQSIHDKSLLVTGTEFLDTRGDSAIPELYNFAGDDITIVTYNFCYRTLYSRCTLLVVKEDS